jgi:predicted RNase H-like HicB family nuclease
MSHPTTRPIAVDVPVSLTAIVRPEPDAGGYSASIPALPGCHTQGETLDEVRANLREAAEGWLAVAHDEAMARDTGGGAVKNVTGKQMCRMLTRCRRREIKLGCFQPARDFVVPRLVLCRVRAHGFSLKRMASRAISLPSHRSRNSYSPGCGKRRFRSVSCGISIFSRSKFGCWRRR